jgi:hypothetical protein
MQLTSIDWIIMATYFVFVLAIGAVLPASQVKRAAVHR